MRFRVGLGVAVMVAAGVGAVGGGCASHRATEPVVIKDNAAPQLGEAQRLATEALKQQKLGKTDKAIELYQESLQHSQDLPLVWNNLGMLLMEKGDYMDAAEAFNSAASLRPDDPRPYYNVGIVYQKANWQTEALEYFVRSLERDPRYLPSLRAAVAVGQIKVLTDEPALKRVRTALLLETDPTWRKIEETEQLRIENELKGKRASASGG